MSKPLMFDLCCGLGGATEGFLAEGWHCIGVDIERHQYGNHRYPSQLWIQDICTINGAQLKDAAFLWASVPCQFFSYCAMPWSKAKALAEKVRSDPVLLKKELALFDACFRIQREACEAAGRHIPMVVENVKGAQPWVGRARWSFGSFYLWGDVPALMPPVYKASKVPGFRFDGNGGSFQSAAVEGVKVSTMGAGWYPPGHPKHVKGLGFNTHADRAIKNAHNTTSGKWQNPDGRKTGGAPHIRDGEAHAKHLTNPDEHGRKGSGGTWFHEYGPGQGTRNTSSGSKARKFVSAMIAKIPEPLSRHIARTFHPGGTSKC